MAEPIPFEPSVVAPPPAPGLLSNPDDLSAPFLAEVQQARTDDSLKWLRSVTGTATPAAPAADQAAPPSAPPGATVAGPGAPPQARAVERAGGAADALLRFVKDVSRGATIEAPAQIAGGATDAVRQYATSAQSLAEWMNGLVNLKVPVPVDAVRLINPPLRALSDQSLSQLMEDPFQFLKDRLPNIYKADTNTGGVVRAVSHFLTSLAIGTRVAGAVGVPAGTPTMMAGGAVADFAGQDPNAGRLADLLDRVPALRGPITDFLKSDPSDPEMVKRLKNAGEGLGLGLLTEGLARGLKMVRAGTVAARGPGAAATLADDALDAARLRHGDIPPASLGLGDPAGALVTVRDASPAAVAAAKVRGAAKAADAGVPVDVVARGVAGDVSVGLVEGKGVFVNFARINTADDVKSVIDQVATAFAPRITARARGVQSNELTKALADDLGMTVQDVLQRRAGQPFNAEQALAAREVMNTTAQQLVELSRKAALPSASQIDLFAFQKMLSIHTAVQTEVLAARTETARALQAWSIPAGVGGIEMSRNVRAALDGFGGDRAVRDVAARLAGLTDAGASAAAVNNLVRASVLSRTGDAIKEAWINGLLSGWKTHIVNTTSNAMAMMNAVLERRLAESISAARGAAGGVVPGEAMAMMHGYVQASGEAFQMAWQALRHGKTGGWRGTLEDMRPRAISADALGLADDALGRSVDFLGKAYNIPGRLMMTSDEFFKTMAYRAEVHAHSLRQATMEGLTGPELGVRIQQLLLQPPEHIRLAAVDSALYATFAQNTSTVGKALLEARAKIPGAFVVAPFVRTPVNVVNYGFEHSPLAPIVGQWRADLAAGGARADLAMARVAMGTTVLLTAIDMADRDLITGAGVHTKSEGGRKEALQRQGWQPYSIRVGDKYIGYDRMDPVGMTIGMAANLSELVRRSDISPTKMDDLNEVVAATTAAISNTVVSKTYLQGISQFFAAMNDPAQNVSGWIGRLEGSMVPSIANATRQLVDPAQRENMKIWDYVTNRLPGLSDSLPPRRDLWGHVETDRSGMGPAFNSFSPMQVSQVKASPVDAEMQRLNMGVDRIKRRVDWDGVAVDLSDWPKVYDAYVRLAGNDLKHPAWNMGAKEFLDAVVTGKHPMEQVYRMGTDGDDGGKAAFIKRTISSYREMARAQIMADPEFQDFAEVIRRGREEMRARRMPVTVR